VLAKTKFLASKVYAVLYHDLFALFKDEEDIKPTLIIPSECFSSVKAEDNKRIEITALGHTESTTLALTVPEPEAFRQWVHHLTATILQPVERVQAQQAYGSVLNGRFWENDVGIALSNRTRMLTVPGRPVPPPASATLPVSDRIVVLKGKLDKKSPKAFLGQTVWQARFFVLHPDSLLYYENQNSPFASGAILFDDIESIEILKNDPAKVRRTAPHPFATSFFMFFFLLSFHRVCIFPPPFTSAARHRHQL
jgi:hypothetical protein